MIELKLQALAESATPYHYKKWKPDLKDNHRAIKAFIMDPDADNEKSKLFRKIAVPISKKYYPEPDKTEGAARNKRYIDAVKSKAEEEGKVGLTGKEYGIVSGIGKNVKKTVPVTSKIFKKGYVFRKYEAFYNIKTGKFTTKPKGSSTQIVKVEFELDFIYLNGKGSGFIVIFAIEKSVDPNSIIYKLGEKGIDIVAAFVHDAVKHYESLEDLRVYILGIETETGNSGVLMEWSAMTMQVGRQSYTKRIPTIQYAIKNDVYDSYDFFSMKDEHERNWPVTIALNPRIVNQRESKLYW